jgi:hypothetical protein
MAQDRDQCQHFCEHGNELSGSIRAGNLNICVTVSFAMNTVLHAVSYFCIAVGPLRWGESLYEGHIYFERNMGAG